MTLYDPDFKRLRIRYFINESDIQEELKLPFCSSIEDTNITNSSSVTRHQYQSNRYKNSILKRINRRSPVTIKGIITADSRVSQHLQITSANTLDYYLYALNHLENTVIYIFDGRNNIMNIENISVDSIGETRNFEISGYRVC